MRRVLRAADPRELPLVLVLLAATLAEGHWSADAEGLSPLGVLAALLLVVPLLWRHAAPHLVLAFVVLGVFACMATLKPGWSVVAASAVAIYSVALYGDRVRSLLTAGCILAVTVTVMTLFSDRGLLSYDALTRLGILLIALILGDAVRGRRAERAGAAERAAERERRARDEADRRLGDERLRIPREVHDVVAHAMVAINVQAGVAAHLLDDDSDQAREALRNIKRTSGDALMDLRATLGVLRDPEQPVPTGPSAGLDDLDAVAGQLRAAGVEVVVDVETVHSVPAPVHAASYRIVQEALTNVLRHAHAHAASVVVRADDTLTIVVADDGTGPDRPGAGAGAGVRGMRERAEALGGTLQAGPRSEGGWRVEATLPLAPS